MNRLSSVLPAVLLLGLATACAPNDANGSPETGSGSPTTASGTSSGGTDAADRAEGIDSAAARRALRQAVQTMRYDEATGFESITSYGGTVFNETRGVVIANAWRSVTKVTSPVDQQTIVMRARSTTGRVWMQMIDWPPTMNGCWLQMSAGTVPVGILAMRPDEPVYYSLLGALRTRGFADQARTMLVGDMRADAAINLLPAQMVGEFDLTNVRGSDRVPVVMALEDGRVEHVTMKGTGVLRMLDDADGSPTGDIRTAVEGFEIAVSYTVPGTAPEVSRPPANLVVKTDGGTCH